MGTLKNSTARTIEEAAKIIAHDGHEQAVRVALVLCERAKRTGEGSQLASAWLTAKGTRREELARLLQQAEDKHLPSIQDQMAQVAARPKGFLGPFAFLASEACRFLGLNAEQGVELMREIDSAIGLQMTAEETAKRAGAAPPKREKPEK